MGHGIGMIHPNDRKFTEETFSKAMKDGLPYDIEYRIIRPDDEKRFVRGIGKIEKNQKGDVVSVFGIGQDITEGKRAEVEKEKLEVQLFQSQKMESIGTLAGGIAKETLKLLRSSVPTTIVMKQNKVTILFHRKLFVEWST